MQYALGAFIGLSKDFNTVDYQILIKNHSIMELMVLH